MLLYDTNVCITLNSSFHIYRLPKSTHSANHIVDQNENSDEKVVKEAYKAAKAMRKIRSPIKNFLKIYNFGNNYATLINNTLNYTSIIEKRS